MNKELLDLYNQLGIESYSVVVLFSGIILSYVFDFLAYLSNFFCEKALYYHDKRKELKYGSKSN